MSASGEATRQATPPLVHDPEALYHRAFRRSADAISVSRLADGVIVDANDSYLALIGRRRHDVIGRRAMDLGLWEHPGRREELLTRVRERGSVKDFDVAVLDGGGRRRRMLLSADVVEDGDVPLLFVIGRDVTERVEAEEELVRMVGALRRTDAERRDLLARLVRAQEEERRRIAMELHDDPVQKLTAVGIRLQLLRGAVAGTPDEAKLQEVSDVVHLTIHRMRRLMFELRPTVLDRAGLVAAIRELVDRLSEEGAFVSRIEDRLTCEPREDDRVLAYRIVQEALTNVARHAEAAHVDVLADEQDAGLYVRIADDGKGFDPEEAIDRAGHLGLTAMRERAEVAGGWWRASSGPGRGAIVEFWLPRRCREASIPA